MFTQSSKYRYVLVILGAIQIFLTSAVIFGWAPLELVLESEGVFHEKCPDGTPVTTICDKQLVQLGLMFTLASTLFPMVQFPGGYIVDRFGSWAGMIIGQAIFAVGCILMGMSRSQWLPSDDGLFIPGFICMGIGGSISYLVYFPVASLFPTRGATVMAILMGAVDASAGVLFGVKALVMNGVVTRSHILLFYTIVPVSIAITFWLWPNKAQYASGEHAPIMSSRDLKNRPFKNQLLSKEFLYLLIFLAIQMLRISYYIGTVPDRIRAINGVNGTTDLYVDMFGIFLPLGGVVASFFAGPFLDRKGISFSCWVYNVGAIACALTTSIPVLWIQLVTFTIFSLVRPFMYTLSAVIVAQIFGTTNFGKIYGSLITLSSVVNLLQYPFLNITHLVLNGNYLPIDLILTASLVGMFFFPYYLTKRDIALPSGNERKGLLDDVDTFLN